MNKNHLLLYGKKTITECLLHDPDSIRVVYLQEGLDLPDLEKLITGKGIEILRMPEKKINDLKRARNVQGVIARIAPYTYSPLKDIIAGAVHNAVTPVILDGVNDPHNLGVILRGLACFGRFSVVIPEKGASPVNETVLHVAMGGNYHVPVCRVPELTDAVQELKGAGAYVLGAVVDNGTPVADAEITFPAALVLGAEDTGIGDGLLTLLDERVMIPMPGAPLSLNVSMACTVLAYEINKKRSEQ